MSSFDTACGLFMAACTTDPGKVECKHCLRWLVRAGQTAEGKLRAAEGKGADCG